MNPHDSNYYIPPITEVTDYIWSCRHDRPCFISGKTIRKPKDISRRISHPDAESALQAAKKACRFCPGRWNSRSTTKVDAAEFLVYEGIKVIERHAVAQHNYSLPKNS